MNDTTPLPAARDHQWNSGEQATFHYSLGYDPNSTICTDLFPRTGQVVSVVERGDDDADYTEMPTFEERADAGSLAVYTVRFPDGFEHTAFEDELVEV